MPRSYLSFFHTSFTLPSPSFVIFHQVQRHGFKRLKEKSIRAEAAAVVDEPFPIPTVTIPEDVQRFCDLRCLRFADTVQYFKPL